MSNTSTEPVKPEIKPLAVGDIFRMSWGYDQTNVDYFQVVRLTPKGAIVREIGQEAVEGTGGFMSCQVRPVPGKFLDKSSWVKDNSVGVSRRVQKSGGGAWSELCFTFESRYFARRVNSTDSTYCSWYA